jgi:hypothetical protein
MRVAGVSTGPLVCPITVVVAVVELVGQDGLWWRIREDGGVSVETDFMFRSSPHWARAAGLLVVVEESFTATGRQATTVVVVEEVGADGLLPRYLTVRPERPTREVEVVADVIRYPALRVDRVWWWWTIRLA